MTPAIVLLATSIFALAFTFSQSVHASTAALSSSSDTSDLLSLSSSDATSECVTFDSEERMITINCRTINLTQIDSQIKNPDVIRKDTNVDKDGYLMQALQSLKMLFYTLIPATLRGSKYSQMKKLHIRFMYLVL